MNPSYPEQAAPEWVTNSETEFEMLARAEHLRVIFKNSSITLLANLLGGSTLVVGLWSVAPHRQLLGWLAILGIVNFVRWAKGRHFAKGMIDVSEVRLLEILLVSGTLITGLLWGTAAILFYMHEQPEYSMFLALILVAMTAASTTLLSFHRYAFLVFCTPAVIPLIYQLSTDEGVSQTAIALVIPIYYFFLMLLSRQIYKFSNEAIVTSLGRQRDALVDQLTAIPNRRAFEEFLEREWVRGIRTRRPLALIVSDVDEFKTYNDRYGHAVGDAVLRSVAGVFLNAARRRTDLAARIGGDEFAIIAPETDHAGVTSILQRIRQSRDELARGTFEAWEFPTLSLGFCTVEPSDSGSVFELFEAADAALYEAKLAGRNRTAGCTTQ
jgi:diguanylate cyclase (GGDEF)-like protein